VSSNVQVITLLFNLLYGFLFFFICKLNYFLVKSEVILLKVFVTVICVLDISMIYLIIIYKLNFGIFHIYYFLFFLLGFYIAHKSDVKIMSTIKKSIDLIKHNK